MDNNQRKAKIQTYMLQLHNGNIRGNQSEVLDYIWKHSGCTIADLRRDLCIPHQTASSALSVLMDFGMVKEVGQEKLDDSVYSKLQFEPDSEEQDKLAEDRLEEKFKQWKQKGRDFFDLMDDELRESLGYTVTFTGLK